MKKTALLILCSFFLVPAKSINYCASSSWGYAGNVTGGGNATPTLVKSENELKNALKNDNKVIIITQDITISDQISVSKNNLTVMALPGVKLISEKQEENVSGILGFSGSNIILRNITFEGPGAFDCDGKDNLTLDGAHNVWVDHCDFQDGCDGNFDIKGNSDDISVTWCRFRYLKAPRSGGKETDDHRFSNLVGSNSSDKPNDGTYNITYGYCWWDEGCKERMTRCRNCLIHYINCYWNSSVANYYVGPEKASSYFEGCTFAGKANTAKNIYKSYNGTTNYCKFVNCSGNLPSNNGSVSAPSYAYDQLTAAEAKTCVTNGSCGAGATLVVTTTGEASSSCDSGSGGETPEPDPQPGTMTWNISDAAFNGLGTISSETIINGLHIVATSAKTITSDNIPTPISIDGYELSGRLKLGGSGSSTYRHLWFNVTGSCTISVYLASSGSDTRTLNIDEGTFGNTKASLSAQSSLTKETYTYTGGATKFYLYSTASGINIFGINIAYSGSATEIETVQKNNAAQKVLRNGQLLILREGKSYTILGLNQ